jgi:HEPN domain-containing protein
MNVIKKDEMSELSLKRILEINERGNFRTNAIKKIWRKIKRKRKNKRENENQNRNEPEKDERINQKREKNVNYS